MQVTLSSADLARLERALATLSSPLAHASADDWGDVAMVDVAALLRADQAFFALPGVGTLHLRVHGARAAEAARSYELYYWRVDVPLTQRRRALGLEVYHRDMLYRPGELARDELHNEWCVRHRLFDTLGMGVQLDDGAVPAGLHVYHERAHGKEFGERGLVLMQLLLPAFKAGVHAWCALHHQRSGLASAMDASPLAALLLSEAGVVLHETPRMHALLAADVEGLRLRAEMARVAGAVTSRSGGWPRAASDGTPRRTLRTVSGCYHVSASWLPAGHVAAARVLCVTLERASVASTDATSARARFGLSAREIEVARHVAEGVSTAEVARRLGISTHTARHHVEALRTKLGVRRAGQIAAMLTAPGSATGG